MAWGSIFDTVNIAPNDPSIDEDGIVAAWGELVRPGFSGTKTGDMAQTLIHSIYGPAVLHTYTYDNSSGSSAVEDTLVFDTNWFPLTQAHEEQTPTNLYERDRARWRSTMRVSTSGSVPQKLTWRVEYAAINQNGNYTTPTLFQWDTFDDGTADDASTDLKGVRYLDYGSSGGTPASRYSTYQVKSLGPSIFQFRPAVWYHNAWAIEIGPVDIEMSNRGAVTSHGPILYAPIFNGHRYSLFANSVAGYPVISNLRDNPYQRNLGSTTLGLGASLKQIFYRFRLLVSMETPASTDGECEICFDRMGLDINSINPQQQFVQPVTVENDTDDPVPVADVDVAPDVTLPPDA